ncbi:ATP-binding cassette domain-containing protein [Streptosporangium lutulentum]
MNELLEITGLEKRYGDKGVLRGVDLTVLPGQVLGLLGANGAGKTTLVSIAAGLRSADGGTVKVAGIDVARHPGQAQTHMGIAPQELGIYPTLTVAANISLFAQLAGLKGQAAQARVEEVAHLLGLHDRLGTKAEVLSGGQKRRCTPGWRSCTARTCSSSTSRPSAPTSSPGRASWRSCASWPPPAAPSSTPPTT